MILELLMITGAVSGVLILGNAIFGRMFDRRMKSNRDAIADELRAFEEEYLMLKEEYMEFKERFKNEQ